MQPETLPTRRLAAVLAVDMVGYTRRMAEDADATIAALRALRAEVLGPVFASTRGTVFNSMGDGWLVEFGSATDAVTAAMQVQDRLAHRGDIALRMGIHIGDVTRTGGEFYGDGINIAARLESIAPAGGVMISDAVYSGLDGTLAPSFEAAGARVLKNVPRKVTVWLRDAAGHAERAETPRAGIPPELPVVTLHPVANSDPRSDLVDLANALTSDLQSYLDSVNWLESRPLANGAAEGYRLVPTLRARGDRLRLETRLLSPDGATIWTHKSETTLDDSFDWQDAVVGEIADHSVGMILEAETLGLADIPDDRMTATQCMLMGIMAWRSFAPEAFLGSVRFHARAIAADPTLPDPYAEAIIVMIAARTMTSNTYLNAFQEKVPDWVEAARSMAPGHANLTLAIALADYMRDRRDIPLRQTVALVLRLTPFDARVLSFCGWANLWSGYIQDAHDCFMKSISLGRLGPFLVASHGGAATASIMLGHPEAALRLADEGLTLADSYPTLYSTRAAALALLDRPEEARAAMQKFLALEPLRSLATWRQVNPYGGHPGAEIYFDGLLRAGLPPE